MLHKVSTPKGTRHLSVNTVKGQWVLKVNGHEEHGLSGNEVIDYLRQSGLNSHEAQDVVSTIIAVTLGVGRRRRKRVMA